MHGIVMKQVTVMAYIVMAYSIVMKQVPRPAIVSGSAILAIIQYSQFSELKCF